MALEHTDLLEQITTLTEQAVAGSGLDVVEVQLRGSGAARLLRVFIDKAGGVTHGDCELVSERLGALLDERDTMPGTYTLEVSSPGVDRKLVRPRDFERVVGQKVKLQLAEPPGAARRLEGKLLAVANGVLSIELAPGDARQIPLERVQKANLKFEW